MVHSSPKNQIDVICDNWVEIGALMPMSPRAPAMRRNRSSSLGIVRRSIPSGAMVKSAITTLMRNPRAGVSLFAIKKYIAENYCDSLSNASNRFRFVKRYIKNSLDKGELIRTKGVGVSGSFRLPYEQRIFKKTLKKAKKNKKKRSAIKKVKAIRKQLQQQLEEINSKINSNAGTGGAEGAAGEAGDNVDYASWTADEQITAKTVS